MRAHDVNVRAIVCAGAAIALTVTAAVVAVFLLLRHWNLPARIDSARLPYELAITGPALQSAPQADLAQYRVRKQQSLRSSASVDATQGMASIPIADAMERLARGADAAAS